jgi:hypothetical protein
MDSETTPKATRVTHDAELEGGIFATPGGLQDEDEGFEQEVALSSPVKAGKRLTTNVSACTALILVTGRALPDFWQGLVKVKSVS